MFCALLLGLLWGLFHESLVQYCVDQPRRQESFAGESITILCSFTYLEPLSPDSVNFVVKASSHQTYCGQDQDIIYNFSGNYTSTQYTGRLSVQFDLGARTSSLAIKDLRSEDEQMYCCRLIIKLPSGQTNKWQHPDGTKITVKAEKEMILNQEHLILALPGDTVTIIARFTFKNRNMSHNITECRAFRSSNDNICEEGMNPFACTQRINENIVSLTINSSDESHSGFYCYSINVSVGGSNYTGQTNIGTQLLLLKPSGALNIKQTMEVEFTRPVRINCSFSIQDMLSTIHVGNRSVLWTQVYWMVGEPREHFVYHPNEDYIHPDYKGKTKLIGQSDLLLEDFHGPDNTTLYCRVAVRGCLQNTYPRNPPNPIATILEEGPGTILRVRETIGSKSETSNSWLQTIVIASCVGCAVLLFLVLLIICFKARKGTKKSNSGETIGETIDLSVHQNSAYENIERVQRHAAETDDKMVNAVVKPSETTTARKPQVSEEPEDDKMVYAVVKPSATTTARKPQVSEEPEVVYAAVKKG